MKNRDKQSHTDFMTSLHISDAVTWVSIGCISGVGYTAASLILEASQHSQMAKGKAISEGNVVLFSRIICFCFMHYTCGLCIARLCFIR